MDDKLNSLTGFVNVQKFTPTGKLMRSINDCKTITDCFSLNC